MTSTIKVDTIQDAAGNTIVSTDASTVTIKNPAGTTALTIDGDGVVTKGVVPSFRLGLTSDQSVTDTSANTVVWDETSTDNCFMQGGMSLSSGIITVPAAGVYSFYTNLRLDGIGSGYVVLRIVLNNDESNNSEAYYLRQSLGGTYDTVSLSTLFKMDANDTVKVTISSQSDTSYHVDTNSQFIGHLVG